MRYFVYVVRCSDGTLYTGVALDVAARITEHNTGTRGAKYTRARRPVTLQYREVCNSRSEAQQREAAIKKLSRQEKLLLIRTAPSKSKRIQKAN